MTEKILREMIATDIEIIDFVIIAASNETVEFKLYYGWDGMKFKILITSSDSSGKTDYSASSIQQVFSDFTSLINKYALQVNFITYVLNQEHGIFVQNHFESQEVAYTFSTQMRTIDLLNVFFTPLKENLNYKDATANFNNFISNLKLDYSEFKVEISSLTPSEVCRHKKLQKLFADE